MNNNSRMFENKSVRYLVYADIPGFDELAKEMEENENIPARSISKPAQPKIRVGANKIYKKLYKLYFLYLV
ncbi:MAG: hypothetical protein A7316_00145 [Candidatus Altiarchaeales archaeon WOR_SM1_86-2]|nr:MAG: hypothetical protein A7316_00145 [Candidatus Altiarchaeales archaeon WOR_SM1_86-2]